MQAKLDEAMFYTCEYRYPKSTAIAPDDSIRYPKAGQISWFGCCANQTFIYYIQNVSEIEILPTNPPTIFSADTRGNIGYGTLTGLLMFAIIVAICWVLRDRSEKRKIAHKEAEKAEREKMRKENKTEK